jgi:hypothetical protein
MRRTLLIMLLVLCAVSSGHALERRAYMMKDDFGTADLADYDCHLQYYYFVPCPTFSWFWGFYGWVPGDIIGTVFTVGDQTTGAFAVCDTAECFKVAEIRVLEFAGYGGIYPGLFTQQFDIYCADEFDCPVGPSLWNSGPVELAQVMTWNIIPVTPEVDVSSCFIDTTTARFVVTATHIGTGTNYPEWGMDNISTLLEESCDMHDIGCLPVEYPRPTAGNVMHSGYYGNGTPEYCPPLRFLDGGDTTQDGSLYGFLELAWRIRLTCTELATQPSTWGDVKSLYR